jgi:radical SAM protein (TIGR01212 family)
MTLDLLEELANTHYVSVEYGLQTIHNKTLDWMNRGHYADSFFDVMRRSQGRKLDLVAHIILGLPGETTQQMLESVDAAVAAKISGIKIHNLHVVKNTLLYQQYLNGGVQLVDRDAYLNLLISVLERVPDDIVIHRLLGDAPPQNLVAPLWVLEKQSFLIDLENKMRHQDTYQGRVFKLTDCRFPNKIGNLTK